MSAIELRVSEDEAGSVWLVLTAEGETLQYPVVQAHVPDMGPQDWSENLRSLLVDFVAESRRSMVGQTR